MTRLKLLLSGLLVAVACTACQAMNVSPSSLSELPQGSTTNSLVGTWTSSSGAAVGSQCKDFAWTITSQTATNATGTISATCLGSIPLTADASAQLAGSTLQLVLAGTATLPGPQVCDFTINGTATLDGDTIHIPYTGTTCLGPVSGTETLKKAAPAPPPPPPPAPPTPPPPPPPPPSAPEPWELCASLVNDKVHLSECVHDAINPGSSGALAFEVTKRIAWLLRGEGAGLLIKNGGENVILWMGYSFSISRICYPDGHIFKVIGDAGDGGTNVTSWADNGYVDPIFYLPPIDPKSGG